MQNIILMHITLHIFRIFSVDVTDIPLDSSASDSTHNTVVYDNKKNQYVNNISVTQRSLSDIYVAFKWEYNTIIYLNA